jgi:peptidyl-prolyl cis-trans isomerase SurA
MKKFFLLSVATFLITLLAVAQPVTQAKRVIADKIVAVVGDKIVLKSDIDNSISDMQRQGIEVPENGRCLTLEQALGIKALVLQAEKDSLPVTDEEVEVDIDNRIRNYINQFGSKDELEKVAGKSVYQLKE